MSAWTFPLIVFMALASGCLSSTSVSRTDLDFAVVSSVNGASNQTGGELVLAGTDGIVVTPGPADGTLTIGHAGRVRTVGSIQACTSPCDTTELPDGMLIAEGSILSFNNLTVNAGGPDHDSGIFFFDGGAINGQSFLWEDASDQFVASRDLEALGNLTARHHVGTVTTIRLAPSAGGGLAEVETAALEGNEVAVFLRGSAKLSNGTLRIDFPAAFKVLVGEGPITAQVTPTSRGQALMVSEKATDHIVVETVTGAASEQTFDYFVQAARAGSDGFETIR